MTFPRLTRVLPVAAATLIVSFGPLAAGPAGAAPVPVPAALQPAAYIATRYADKVDALSTVTDTFTAFVSVGGCPGAMASTPNGRTVYAGNTGSDTVTPIDTATNTAQAPITFQSTDYETFVEGDRGYHAGRQNPLRHLLSKRR